MAVVTMDKLISLCKRKGFVFQSSEIYGGFNGFFDFGPLGVELRRNIRQIWWYYMVQQRSDMVGLESSILMNPTVWEASGHVGHFSDPLVDCKVSKKRYRADQLFFAKVQVEGHVLGYISALESERLEQELEDKAQKMSVPLELGEALMPLEIRPFTEALVEEIPFIPSPETGRPGSLMPARHFNLMFETQVGAIREESSLSYLRPETAQGIFVNFKSILESSRKKLPLGIAQIGKAFRNEITPRNFIFRSREFEQMEIEYFIDGPEDAWKSYYQEWVQTRLDWYERLGISQTSLKKETHSPNKLAHYAKACTDILYQFPFGFQEIEGIAARGNYDLTQHANKSGQNLSYFDEKISGHYLPQVIEPSAGLDRIFLAVLCEAYDEDEIEGETRVVLRFHPRVAPIKAAVLPLVKNKSEIVEMAQKFYQELKLKWNVEFESSGAIGRRYRRMDEIGVPFCVTVDYTSLEDQTVTLRERDSMQQKRYSSEALIAFLEAQFRW